MTLARFYPWCWIGLAVAFSVFELTPLIMRHPEFTLSDYIWKLEGPGWSFFRYFVAAFCIWFGGHMIWRWWR